MITLSLDDFDKCIFLGHDTKMFRYANESIAAAVLSADPHEQRYHIETDNVGNKIVWRRTAWDEWQARRQKSEIPTDPVLYKLTLKLGEAKTDSEREQLTKVITAYKEMKI